MAWYLRISLGANLFYLNFTQLFVGAGTARTNICSVVILPKFYEYQLKVLFASSPHTLRVEHQFRLFNL